MALLLINICWHLLTSSAIDVVKCELWFIKKSQTWLMEVMFVGVIYLSVNDVFLKSFFKKLFLFSFGRNCENMLRAFYSGKLNMDKLCHWLYKILIVFIYKLCLSFVLPYFQSGRSFGNYYNWPWWCASSQRFVNIQYIVISNSFPDLFLSLQWPLILHPRWPLDQVTFPPFQLCKGLFVEIN
jgi:hypothetical protein